MGQAVEASQNPFAQVNQAIFFKLTFILDGILEVCFEHMPENIVLFLRLWYQRLITLLFPNFWLPLGL